MFRGHLDYSEKPPLGGRSNTKSGDVALRTLTTMGLFYFIMSEDSCEEEEEEETSIPEGTDVNEVSVCSWEMGTTLWSSTRLISNDIRIIGDSQFQNFISC